MDRAWRGLQIGVDVLSEERYHVDENIRRGDSELMRQHHVHDRLYAHLLG